MVILMKYLNLCYLHKFRLNTITTITLVLFYHYLMVI